jgi:predicted flap endonuclease-1-like 5' DNA nuclease
MIAKAAEPVVEAAPAVVAEPPAMAGAVGAGVTAFAVEEAKVEEAAEETVVEEVEALPEVKTVAPDFSGLDENAKFGYELEYIEGIGPAYAQKFYNNDIHTIRDFFERGVTAKGREELAECTGISSKLILEWINHVDLYRIKGVGSEYADLLEEAGVDTVVELANRNATNLFNKMLAVNQEKKLVRRPPVESQVQDWVQQAKTLPRRVTY